MTPRLSLFSRNHSSEEGRHPPKRKNRIASQDDRNTDLPRRRMKLYLGLGNPGKKYGGTRHNLGFVALEQLADAIEAPAFKEDKKFHALVTTVKRNSERLILAKPDTFMNNSGVAAAALVHFYKIAPNNLWVFHDDLDLPVGTVRHSFDSRAAGHNGVQSVIDALGTKAFHRIRIGIGRPTGHTPVEAFVLQKLSADEKKVTTTALDAFLPTL